MNNPDDARPASGSGWIPSIEPEEPPRTANEERRFTRDLRDGIMAHVENIVGPVETDVIHIPRGPFPPNLADTLVDSAMADGDTRTALICSLSGHQGLLFSEIARAKLQDVDLAAGEMRVRARLGDRVVQLDPRTLKQLRVYLNERDRDSSSRLRSPLIK